MAVYRNDFVDIDFDKGSVFRSFSNRILGEGDSGGDRFGIRAYRQGAPLELTGVTCTGYFEKANGTTDVISGVRTGNEAYVQLASGNYTITGPFKLTIKLTSGGQTVSARIVDGTIVNTVAGSIVDPGSVVPDVTGLTALAERIEAAAAVIDALTITTELIEGTRYKIDIEI